ncbi:MAG: porin family protein [Nitrospiraceae bacterium]
MQMKRWAALALWLLIPGSASAEFALDLYGGATRGNVDLTVNGTAINDLSTYTRPTVGVRLGYWLPSAHWFGMGLDVFYMEPDIENQTASTPIGGLPIAAIDISTLAVAFDAIKLRAPLIISEDFPHGRFQPALALGPALFFSEVKDTNNFNPPNQSQRDTRLGFKANAGATFMLTRTIGLFGEYRFTYYQIDAPFTTTVPGFGTASGTVEHDMMVHALIGGLTLRFGE